MISPATKLTPRPPATLVAMIVWVLVVHAVIVVGAGAALGPALHAFLMGVDGLAIWLLLVVRRREHLWDRELRRQSLYATILDRVTDPVLVLGGDGRALEANPALQDLLGVNPSKIGGPWNPLAHMAFSDRDGRPVEPDQMPSSLALAGTELSDVVYGVEFPGRPLVWMSVSTRLLPRPNGPSDPHIVLTGIDVTTHVQRQNASTAENNQLRRQALYDSLTGLPNRALLIDRLGLAEHRADRRVTSTAIMMIDLDGFKAINDTRGHAVGDEVLVQVAVRLRTALRSEDTAARLGGDEFVVLLENLYSSDVEGEARMILGRMRATLDAPYLTTAGTVFVSASIGCSIASPGERIDLRMMNQADSTMLLDKRSRRIDRHAQLNTPITLAVPDDDEDAITVFIVDDDPAMRLLATRILEPADVPVIIVGDAGDGRSAVQMITDARPDIVLCDVMMPGFSGPDVVAAVRNVVPDQRFAFWSATTATQLDAHQRSLGVPYVEKDRIEELATRLREVMALSLQPMSADAASNA